jgi:2-keto-4-pentenoate hydratase
MDHSSARAAATIVAARRHKRRMPHIDPRHQPDSLIEAYAIQDQVVKYIGGEAEGWKIGCTNVVAQAQLGVDEPFRGRVLRKAVYASPATVSAGDTMMRVVETELAFRMGAALPMKNAPYTKETVEPAIEALIPSLEIVDSVWEDWEKVGALHLIADNACHAGLVLGADCRDWRDVDLAEYEVSVSMNGEAPLTGKGGNALGHPLNGVAWLANDLASLGRELKAGEVISTGVLTGLIYANAGDHIVADYGQFGKMELTFED